MKTIKSKIEAKMNDIRASQAQTKLQDKITAKLELQKSLKNPLRGKGSTILENFGENICQSGGVFKNCKKPEDCAVEVLTQLSRYIQSGEHVLVYKNDGSLLISIDNIFYEISGFDLKNSILKFARKAGVPFEFIGTSLAKLLIEGIVKIWQKYDQNFKEINRLVK